VIDELLDVGEQDARLKPWRAHLVPGDTLLGWVNRVRLLLLAGRVEGPQVVGARGARREPDARHVLRTLGRLPDVHADRDARAGEKLSKAAELILGQRVHRVDDDRDDPGRRPLVAQRQAAADDGVEEALRLA